MEETDKKEIYLVCVKEEEAQAILLLILTYLQTNSFIFLSLFPL